MTTEQEKTAEQLAQAMKEHLLEINATLRSARDKNAYASIFMTPATYPSEWFESNGWIKPVLTLPKLLDTDTYAGLKRPIREGITKGSLVNAEDIKLFLHYLLKDVKEEVSKDWVSMGVVVAKKGDKIGLLDLFTLKVEEAGNERLKVAEQEDAEKLAYLILITGCYRISNEKNQFQREKLGKLINTKTVEAGLRGRYVENCLKAMDSASCDRELIKLFSGMDMFYNLFSDSKFARSRVGTDWLRFKDCTALGYLDYLADFMKMEPEDIVKWFVADGLKKDWNGINVPNQEINDPYSYMPYMMGLGLAHKCPYSASTNLSLHNFVHLVGCAALQPRSINAHMFRETFMIVDNAVMFYYAMRRTTNKEVVGDEPKSTRADDWCTFMSAREGIVPEYIRHAVYRQFPAMERLEHLPNQGRSLS